MYKLVKNTTEMKTVRVNGKDVEIPVDWVTEIGKKILNYETGFTPNTNHPEYYEGKDIWVNISDMNSKYISDSNKKINASYFPKKYPVSKGSLLFSFKLSVGRVAFAGDKLFTNEAIWAFTKQSKIPLHYLYYYLPLHLVKASGKNAFGAKFLNQNILDNYIFVLPNNIQEQEEIADFLSHIENTIFKTEELIASMEKRLRYYIRELTSGRLRIQKDGEQINLVENEHFKTVQVNGKDMEIPVDWDVKKINELCNFINGSAFNNKTWTDSGYKIVRIQNLNGSNEYNHYDGDVSDHVIINNNDIIFSWSGTIDIYRWKLIGDYVLNQHIFKVTNTDKLALDYVYYALQSILLKIKKLSHGSTMKHITKQNLYSIDVIYPPNLFKQEDIGNLLLKEEEDIEKMKKLLEMQKKRFKWAMSALLSGRYTLEKVE